MDERNDGDKLDEIMLPGFRFHPTDEELVGFYLKRKIQRRPPYIELIKQLDIYKYDPWDLPKLATTGEKEWYFYCPRDRKYRNSARPNRDSWAICRIFKKTNSAAQRAISHSWVSPILPETTTSDILITQDCHSSQFSSAIQFGYNNDFQQSSITSFSPPLDVPSHQVSNISNGDLPTSYTFSSLETSGSKKYCSVDASSMLLNMSSSIFGDFDRAINDSIDFCGLQEQCNNGFSMISTLPQEILQGHASHGEEETALIKDPNVFHFYDQCGTIRSLGIPFSLPLTMQDPWKLNSLWDSSHCPTELSSTFSTNKCNA
ncbi:hypothetical protein F0562_033771 [Nyssa sinensis]|uniref:NAC domain-containing protein n=1 Tax=Nyssa sinensis TaxID=561372 RepID=A0A5J5AFS1_9ASTE|nr:hypothetical protein F0562_033771 [Nyssa sinensis]